MNSFIRVGVLITIALVCFGTGYLWAMSKANTAVSLRVANFNMASSAFNLVLFSKLLRSLEKNDVEETKKEIFIQLQANVSRVNQADPKLLSAINATDVRLVCEQLVKLNINEQFQLCK